MGLGGIRGERGIPAAPLRGGVTAAAAPLPCGLGQPPRPLLEAEG